MADLKAKSTKVNKQLLASLKVASEANNKDVTLVKKLNQEA